MLNALARRHPLHITKSKPTSGAQGVRMIDKSFGHHGNRFKSPVRMRGETGHLFSMIHPPPLFINSKILPELPSSKRGLGAHNIIAFGIKIFVMDAKQEWVLGLPGEAEGLDGFDCSHK